MDLSSTYIHIFTYLFLLFLSFFPPSLTFSFSPPCLFPLSFFSFFLKILFALPYIICKKFSNKQGRDVLSLLDSGSVQFSSVAQSCPTLCDPMNHSTPGLPVHHQFPEFTQTHVHRVSDAIQPSHSLQSPYSSCPQSLPASQFFQRVNSSHEVAKVLEFQL